MTRRSEFSLAEIARRIGLKEADLAALGAHASLVIRGIAVPEQANAEQLVFIGAGKYVAAVEKSGACAFVVDATSEAEIPGAWRAGKVFLKVSNLKVAMAKASELFAPAEWCTDGVHESAWVDASANLGKNVRIGAHASVGPGAVLADGVTLHAGVRIGSGVRIGADSVIFPNVVIYDDTQLGERVRVHAGAVLGADGFGYAQEKSAQGVVHVKLHHVGRVIVGDDVEIGASTTIDRGTIGDTVIGRGAKIDNQVQIGHNCQIGEGAIICGSVGLAGSVKVGRFAMLGGLTGVANGAVIGDGAMSGGMSGLQGNVAAGSVVAGNPARNKAEAYRIQAAMSHLPEIYKFWKRQTRSEEK